MKNVSIGVKLQLAFLLTSMMALTLGIFERYIIDKFSEENEATYKEVIMPLISLNPEQSESLKQLAIKRKESYEEFANASKNRSILLNIAIFMLASTIGFSINMSITKPLRKVVETLKKGEGGDMRARTGIVRKDEIGKVAKSVDQFFEKIQGILKNLLTNSSTLASSSEELSGISKQLTGNAEGTVSKSNEVADTTQSMTSNIHAMANGARQASTNATEVAGAAEQMSASINLIAGNTGDVHRIATEASGKATDATDVMSKLDLAAEEIGAVTDMIKKIADKTNLLALNATIEAATSGEAGKGFAVVATEIKALASQSAASADDITKRIKEIQSNTSDAVKVINDVSAIITQINDSMDSITGHVTQANSSAKRVAESISEVAKSAGRVSTNAGEAAKGANDVSFNTVSMSEVAKESANGALRVNRSADDLAKIAGELRETVGLFKV
ncbi:MAG: methyl-accepting chemotaxis protein [Fibromonadales bacterium]|nr:methyl-accepting chemotaxis protein [Fibromonadales bacterium]